MKVESIVARGAESLVRWSEPLTDVERALLEAAIQLDRAPDCPLSYEEGVEMGRVAEEEEEFVFGGEAGSEQV